MGRFRIPAVRSAMGERNMLGSVTKGREKQHSKCKPAPFLTGARGTAGMAGRVSSMVTTCSDKTTVSHAGLQFQELRRGSVLRPVQ